LNASLRFAILSSLSDDTTADESDPIKHTTSHALHANVLGVAAAIFWFAVHDGRLAAR
jgi:hypothetical protein